MIYVIYIYTYIDFYFPDDINIYIYVITYGQEYPPHMWRLEFPIQKSKGFNIDSKTERGVFLN